MQAVDLCCWSKLSRSFEICVWVKFVQCVKCVDCGIRNKLIVPHPRKEAAKLLQAEKFIVCHSFVSCLWISDHLLPASWQQISKIVSNNMNVFIFAHIYHTYVWKFRTRFVFRINLVFDYRLLNLLESRIDSRNLITHSFELFDVLQEIPSGDPSKLILIYSRQYFLQFCFV